MADQQSSLQAPGQPQQGANYPSSFQPLVFDGFNGLNTKPTRPAIQDQEMAWCDNWMPLGKSNLRTLPDLGPSIYTAPANDGIAYFTFGNISDTPICVTFLSSGGITQINTATLVSSTIAPAGTILTTANVIAASQWGSQYILMCAPQANGYFIWDGNVFYQAGTVGPVPTITNDGNGYTSQPNMHVVSTHGGGAQFSATLTSAGSLSQITVTNAGSGFTATDYAVVAFSGGGPATAATAIATAVLNSSNGVGAITIVTGGSGYTGAVQVALLGGGGVGATATAVAANSGGPISSVTTVDAGQGYLYPPTVVFTDPNNPVAQATIPLMPFGVQGTGIETYTSRVWIVNGAAPSTPPSKSLTVFSAPGNPGDFSTADGSGSFLDTNSFARIGYHGIKQSNGFLYLIGDSSVDYISGVSTSGSPPVTTFSNQNVDPQVGSPWPNTVQVYSRAIVLANTFGVHAMYGGAVQKVSSPLDGIYTTVPAVGDIPTINGIQPSAAVAIVFGIHIYCLLMPIIDTYTKNLVNKILCWDGQKWFTYQPSITMRLISSQEINSVLTAYGTDGLSIYPLFNTPSTAITKVVQSKLWDTPSYIMRKHAQNILGLFESNDENPDNSTICVDTETGSVCINTANLFGVTWYANSGEIATWYANDGQIATWNATGKTSFVSQIDNSGVLMGLTMTTTAPDYTLISLMIAGQQYNVTV